MIEIVDIPKMKLSDVKWNDKPFEIKGNMLSRNFEIIRGKV